VHFLAIETEACRPKLHENSVLEARRALRTGLESSTMRKRMLISCRAHRGRDRAPHRPAEEKV
jgi:hypothetical protein